jgi:transposase-like protein
MMISIKEIRIDAYTKICVDENDVTTVMEKLESGVDLPLPIVSKYKPGVYFCVEGADIILAKKRRLNTVIECDLITEIDTRMIMLKKSGRILKEIRANFTANKNNAIYESYSDGLSQAEIAEGLGIAANTVRIVLSSSQSVVRKSLKQKAIDLFENGKSYPEIAEIMGSIDKHTVGKWVHDHLKQKLIAARVEGNDNTSEIISVLDQWVKVVQSLSVDVKKKGNDNSGVINSLGNCENRALI